MKLFQTIMLCFLAVMVVGCTQDFEIEQNQNLVNQTISDENKEEVIKSISENEVNGNEISFEENEIELNNLKENKEDQKNEVQSLSFNDLNDIVTVELNKEYSLNIQRNDLSYTYSFYVTEKEGSYTVIINGIEIPKDTLSIYFLVDDKEVQFEKIDDNTVSMSFTTSVQEKENEIPETEITIDVEIEIEDSYVELEWEDNIDNAKWYKVMHSSYDRNPTYPQDNAIGVIEFGKDQEFKHWNPNKGLNYYRISVVLLDDSVMHSEVIEINFEGEMEEEKEENSIQCEGPYKVLTQDNRCVWSCSQGTQPNDETNTCECKEGYEKTQTDDFGRKICEKKEDPNYMSLTDSFNFWSDQSSHNYQTFGTTGSGAYVCDGEISYSDFNYQQEPREDFNSLRLSGCNSSTGSVYLELQVKENSSEIKLMLKEAFGNRDFKLEIEGDDFGLFKSGSRCIDEYYYFDEMEEYTEDGILEILISDGVEYSCAGDPQLSYLEVYS